MEDECGVSQSSIDDFHSSDIKRDEMEGESGVTRSMIDEFHYWDIKGN